MTPNGYARFNRAAVFHPAATPDGLPVVIVAGVLVFAYVDSDGTVRVSVDLDTAVPEKWFHPKTREWHTLSPEATARGVVR